VRGYARGGPGGGGGGGGLYRIISIHVSLTFTHISFTYNVSRGAVLSFAK
jgi:hypothetical protein